MDEAHAVPEAIAGPAVSTDATWFYLVDGKQFGPVTAAEFVRLCATGRVTPDTLVWRHGFVNWIPFSQLNVNIPMGASLAGTGVSLSYGKGEDDPTNMFGWWWKVVGKNYASFRGRARRKEFWYFALVNMTTILAVVLLGVLLADRSDPLGRIAGGGLMILAGLLYLGTITPYIAAAVRRLHDSGKSGWLFLITFVPYVGGIILLLLLAQDSESAVNAYGPNPKSAVRERV